MGDIFDDILCCLLSAIDLDVLDIQLPFISKQEKITKEEKPTGPPKDKEQLKEAMLDTVKEGGMTEREEQEVKRMWIEMKKGDVEMAELFNKYSDDGVTYTSMAQDDMDAFIFNAQFDTDFKSDYFDEF